MSLRLDALRRGKKTEGTRPSASKTTHADAVLASLGYGKQQRRSGVSGQAIALIATAAVLAGLGAWQGAVWLTSRARPTTTPSAARTTPPAPASSQAPNVAPPRFVPAPEAAQAAGQAPATPPAAVNPPPAQTMAERRVPEPIVPEPAAPMPTQAPTRPGPAVRFEAAPEDPSTEPLPFGVAQGAPSGSRGAPVAAPNPPVTRRAAATPPPRFIPAAAARSATQSAAAIEPAEPPAPVAPRTAAVPPPSPNVRPPAGGASEADYFKLALYYQQTGDFENAHFQYMRVLERNEMNAEAHNNLGVLYQNKGLSDEAIREFKRAVSIDPKYAKGHNNLGVALLRTGQVDAAASEFRWLLDADPKNVDALVNLSLALKAGGRTTEAREYLLRALMVKTTHPHVHYNLALLYEEDDELIRALEHYEKFLQYASSEHATVAKDVRNKVANLRARLADIRAKGDR